MTVSNCSYPWTEAGINLLTNIMRSIEREGGNHAMMSKVVKEAAEFFSPERTREIKFEPGESIRKRYWNLNKDLTLMAHWNTHSLKELQKEFFPTVCFDGISRRGKSLGLEDRRKFFINKPMRKVPLLISIGDFKLKKESLSDAATYLGVNQSYIHKALKNNYKIRGYNINLINE